MEASEILTQNVDKTKLPPLHQKRVLAFVNHFLISSCGFLNDFSLQCESRFIELERKLQKVEAALTILEAKLASIPDVDKKDINVLETSTVAVAPTVTSNNEEQSKTELPGNSTQTEKQSIPQGILATEHSLYKKFFKMLQVGVPMRAVQMKMESEGVNPTILDNPSALIPLEADGGPTSNES